MFILGTDEAGYGPNLGPLTVSVSILRTPMELSGEEIYSAFSPIAMPVQAKRSTATTVNSSSISSDISQTYQLSDNIDRDDFFYLDDSKKVYSSQKKVGALAELEKTLLIAVGSSVRLNTIPDNFSQLFNLLTGENSASSQFETPWETPSLGRLPIEASRSQIESLVQIFKRVQLQNQVFLESIRSKVVFPGQFNRLCQLYGNKSYVLSHVTLELIVEVLKSLSFTGSAEDCISDGVINEGDILILCDKHGGRDKYGPLIAEHFADQMDSLLETHIESSEISSYQFSWRGRTCRIDFRAKGDRHPLPALASIACKYLRELFMRQFNLFWTQCVEGLEPTAGYPADAKRFRLQTKSKLEELGIPMDLFWRQK